LSFNEGSAIYRLDFPTQAFAVLGESVLKTGLVDASALIWEERPS
jgi:hypothetical protein